MLPGLSPEQRQMMEQLGTPLPIVDEEMQMAFMLCPIDVRRDPLGGFCACVRGITGTGGGETVQEATLALAVLLRRVLPHLDADE